MSLPPSDLESRRQQRKISLPSQNSAVGRVGVWSGLAGLGTFMIVVMGVFISPTLVRDWLVPGGYLIPTVLLCGTWWCWCVAILRGKQRLFFGLLGMLLLLWLVYLDRPRLGIGVLAVSGLIGQLILTISARKWYNPSTSQSRKSRIHG